MAGRCRQRTAVLIRFDNRAMALQYACRGAAAGCSSRGLTLFGPWRRQSCLYVCSHKRAQSSPAAFFLLSRTMATAMRPSMLLPQCPACARRLLRWGLSSNATPSRQQIRGKKKSTQGPLTVPVKLLKDVTGFGRAGEQNTNVFSTAQGTAADGVVSGAFVPVTRGQFRNDWLPKGIADYVPHSQLKELRVQDVPLTRSYNFVAPEDRKREPSLTDLLPEESETAPAAPAVKLEHLSVSLTPDTLHMPQFG